MQTEMPAVQQTRDLTGVSKPTRTAPDPLDLLEQFGTTVTVIARTRSTGGVILPSYAGGSSMAAPVP
jgi:hypothetical protein